MLKRGVDDESAPSSAAKVPRADSASAELQAVRDGSETERLTSATTTIASAPLTAPVPLTSCTHVRVDVPPEASASSAAAQQQRGDAAVPPPSGVSFVDEPLPAQPAKTYPFVLDQFQREVCFCLAILMSAFPIQSPQISARGFDFFAWRF